GAEHGDALPLRHSHERGAGLRRGKAGSDDKPSRLFQVRPAGGDVHRRILRQHVLQVQPAGVSREYIRADVVAADKSDVVTDAPLARRVAALLGDARVSLEEHFRAPRTRVCLQPLLDQRETRIPQLYELLGTCLTAGELPQDAKAGLEVGERTP